MEKEEKFKISKNPGQEDTIHQEGSLPIFSQLLPKINSASWETQSFPSQVSKSLVAKEKLEDLIQRGEVVGLSHFPCPRQPPHRLEGWAGVGSLWSDPGGRGRTEVAAILTIPGEQGRGAGAAGKQAGVSLNFRWLLSHSPLALGVSFARSLPLRSFFQSLE